MSVEDTTEKPKNNFVVRNFYTPESLFWLLTNDHPSHVYRLQNNWENISENGYDPIGHIDVDLHCDLAAKVPSLGIIDRSTKMFWFSGAIFEDRGKRNTTCFDPRLIGFANFTPSTHYRGISDRGREIEMEGIARRKDEVIKDWSSLQLAPYISSLVYDERIYNYHDGRTYLVGSQRRKALEFDWHHDSYPSEFILILEPFNWKRRREGLLSDPTGFREDQEDFFRILEDTIRTIYRISGKKLPLVKLEFKPSEKKRSDSIAACEYCGANYFVDKSLECSNCGASHPHLII